MKFTDLFVRRPVLALVGSTLSLLLGAGALGDLPVRQYPLTESTTLTITTQYPGASPELMQGFVTQPIAQAVATIENVDYLSSSSTLGRSVISVRMKLNADSWLDVRKAYAKLKDPEIHAALKFGFARGDEAVQFVENIRNYTDIINRLEKPLELEINHDLLLTDTTTFPLRKKDQASSNVSTSK